MSYSVKYERPGSGRSTIRRFFADNPDEELTLQDISLKAGISQESARALVHLEANGIAVLTYIKGSQKGTLPGLHGPRYQWCMA
jgi:hypothetical protein